MESSFVSFVNKPFRLCVSVFVSRVLCSVYFLPFSASYHLPFIFAVIFCFFFLACSCHSLRLLTSVIFTWMVMYWWYHVMLHWCVDIFCGHLLA